MAEWHRNAPEVHEEFIDAQGVVEVTTDGTCVNTTDGWREVKVGIFSKRKLGEGVTPDQWADRKLPRPNACVAFAAIEKKDRFRRRFGQWIRRLRIDSETDVSALGDGAPWIWDAILLEFGKVRECLDVYHALENVSKAGKVLYGEGSPEYETWREETTVERLRVDRKAAGPAGGREANEGSAGVVTSVAWLLEFALGSIVLCVSVGGGSGNRERSGGGGV